MKPNEQNYHAYLIRCWHADPTQQSLQEAWRFSVEPTDGQSERRGFTDPQDVINFIIEQVENAKDSTM